MELCLGVFKRAISCLCHTFYNYQKYLVYFLLCEATITFVWYEWMLHMYQARIHTVSMWFLTKPERYECLCYQITKNKETQHNDLGKWFIQARTHTTFSILSLSHLDSSAVDTESAAINHSLLEHAQSYRSTQPCQALLPGETSCPHSFHPQHGSSTPSVSSHSLGSSHGWEFTLCPLHS